MIGEIACNKVVVIHKYIKHSVLERIFQEQKMFFQGTAFVQLFMLIVKQKNSDCSEKFWKFFDFQKSSGWFQFIVIMTP